MTSTDSWLTVKEAAAYTKKHPRTVSDAIRSTQLKAERGAERGHWRTKQQWLDLWITGK